MANKAIKLLSFVCVAIFAMLLIFPTGHAYTITGYYTSATEISSGLKYCTCENCSDCNSALNDVSCKIVKLNQSITNQTGTCINNPANFNNKIFDCQGHRIDGNDSGSYYNPNPTYGIYLYDKAGNTIKNCIITDFYNGIFLVSLESTSHSKNNNIENNSIYSCGSFGMDLGSSSNNKISNNKVYSNGNIGIYLNTDSSNNNIENNRIYSNNAVGIELDSSSSNNLTNNRIYSNEGGGIYLGYSSNNNILTNNIVNNNLMHGLDISSDSGGNQINSNIFCSNNQSGGAYYDVYMETAGTNAGDDNAGNTSYNWNDTGTTGFTYVCPSTCSDCASCNAALNDTNLDIVYLIEDIINYSGTCINNPANFNNKIFDCQGHIIMGDGTRVYDYGIFLNGKQNNTIKNCIITDFSYGIYLDFSSNNTLTNNTLYSNHMGIRLQSSSNYNSITNNTANYNYDGILLSSSSNYNTLTNNTANLNTNIGIYLSNSNYTMYENTVCLNSYRDFQLKGVQSGINDNNTCDISEGLEGGCRYYCGEREHTVCQCSSCGDCQARLNRGCAGVELTNDLFNLTGCVHWEGDYTESEKVFDCQGHIIEGKGEGTGIEFVNARGFTLKNCIITNFYKGIMEWQSYRINIINNTLTNNDYGISGTIGNDIAIINNTISGNKEYGIFLGQLYNTTIMNNIVNSNNGTGVYLYSSSNNNLTDNTANSNSQDGIYIRRGINNILTDNTANSNSRGIIFDFSPNNNMTNSTMNNNNYNFNIYGNQIYHFYQNIDTSNLVDNKPIYYWTNEKNALNNCKNAVIDENSNAGFVALISCNNITVKNLNLTNNSHGILLVNTTNSKILNNTANLNDNYGIYLGGFSNSNLITKNTANSNSYGIFMESSSNNNTLTNNTANSNYHGIYLERNSNNNTLISNKLCSNSRYGVYSYETSTTGDNNTCVTSYNYNDTNSNGCKYVCSIDSCNCSSCKECTYKLLHPLCSQVNLTANINNFAGTCIDNPRNFNNKIFDCQGYTIKGTGTAGIGIYLNKLKNNVIKNCVVQKFSQGINIAGSNNILFNITASSNTGGYGSYGYGGRGYGIYLSGSNNILFNITANSNAGGYGIGAYSIYGDGGSGDGGSGYGIYLSGSNNTFFNITANSNAGGYGAGHISGVYGYGGSGYGGSGYGIYLSDSNNTFFNITANSNAGGDYYGNSGNGGNGHGIYLSGSNNVLSHTIESFNYGGGKGGYVGNGYGIYLSGSNNILNSNQACANTYSDIKIYSGRGNTGDNTCERLYNKGNAVTCSKHCEICLCSTCDKCERKLNLTNPSCSMVILTENILNQAGTCINNPENLNNKVFDCQGHTIDGRGWEYGIYLNSKQNNTIKKCTITDFYEGIYLDSSSNNILTNNKVYSNKDTGIYIFSSLNNTVTSNTAYSNVYHGICLSSSWDNTVTNNTAYSNKDSGIVLFSSSDNTITNNTGNSNTYFGIYLGSSSNNAITNNTANSNNFSGIGLYYSSNYNTITSNTANSNSGYGIYLYDSNATTINRNRVCGNNQSDILISSGIGNSGDNRCNNLENNENSVTCSQDCNSFCCNGTCHYTGTGKCCNNVWLNGATCCNDSDCGVNEYCTWPNKVCLQKKSGGESCTYNNWCLSGKCTNWVCQSECDYYCNNCSDCNAKIIAASAGQAICLNKSITNQVGTCINNSANFNNKIFDCQGHTIDGTKVEDTYGIFLNGKQNNTIKNCVITDFYRGIFLNSSSNNILTSNTANSNTMGISLQSSSNNTLTNNTANNNLGDGINLYYSSNNILTNNTANLNKFGIFLSSSFNNKIASNKFQQNNVYEIVNMDGSNNIGYNNTCCINTLNWADYEISVGCANVDDAWCKANDNKCGNQNENWNIACDSYNFENPGTHESPGGICYGMASTAILYFMHYKRHNMTYPSIPLPKISPPSTIYLEKTPNEIYNVYLSIIIHQWFDGILLIGSRCTSEESIFDEIKDNIQNKHLPIIFVSTNHAVVAYELEDSDNSDVVNISIYDPNKPLERPKIFYNKTTKKFSPYDDFEYCMAKFPELAQRSWFEHTLSPMEIVKLIKFLGFWGPNDFAHYKIFATDGEGILKMKNQLIGGEVIANIAGFSSDENNATNSQLFWVDPDYKDRVFGFYENGIRIYAVHDTLQLIVSTDPVNDSFVFVFWIDDETDANESEKLIARSYFVTIKPDNPEENRSYNYTLAPVNNTFVLNVEGVNYSADVIISDSKEGENATRVFNFTNISLKENVDAKFEVNYWKNLNSTTDRPVTRDETKDNKTIKVCFMQTNNNEMCGNPKTANTSIKDKQGNNIPFNISIYLNNSLVSVFNGQNGSAEGELIDGLNYTAKISLSDGFYFTVENFSYNQNFVVDKLYENNEEIYMLNTTFPIYGGTFNPDKYKVYICENWNSQNNSCSNWIIFNENEGCQGLCIFKAIAMNEEKATDIFDAVEMLEHLSGQKNATQLSHYDNNNNYKYYKFTGSGDITFLDVFALIDKIVIG